jgi:hypothetical protein
MRFRKLQIAWSVFWCLGCLLSALWWLIDYHDTSQSDVGVIFLGMTCFGFACAPWDTMPSRFSLRTLLIGITLVAILLGLGVYLASK